MNDFNANGLDVLMVLSIFVLMPTLMYMFDKVNKHSEKKRGILFFSYLFPLAPVFYFRVWRKNRSDCSVFPLIVTGAIVVAIVGVTIMGLGQ